MERVVPWAALEALIKPHVPPGRRGRPPSAVGTRRADRTDQGEHPCQGRTSLPCHEAPVQTREGALSRAEEEHGVTADAVRAVEPVVGMPSSADTGWTSSPESRQCALKPNAKVTPAV